MAPGVGKIAAVLADDGTATQALLTAMVTDWRDSGAKIAGVIGELHGLPDRTCGAGFLRDIASGKPYRIYLEARPRRNSCRLDAAGENIHLNVSASFSVIGGRLQRQHARAQEFRPGPTVHGPLESFQAVDLSFCLTVAPMLCDRVSHGVNIPV
jgi:hypothetical protein